ncbi:hypothetical protein BDN70DRAFT_595335 [Pholiota conissans]|uniref:Uncharacterized protein n=1 Tax=Pholiota conissans TaxID=109636 RepID=A0A9P5Z3K2_9AGAR|nr:hypothetical protein BDN70DRAFT_595335 [Pholiota conissans]
MPSSFLESSYARLFIYGRHLQACRLADFIDARTTRRRRTCPSTLMLILHSYSFVPSFRCILSTKRVTSIVCFLYMDLSRWPYDAPARTSHPRLW